MEWQCVELVNRLYITKGWISSTWMGDGDQLYATAASVGLKSEQKQGSISYLAPGDVISFTGPISGGHAAIVSKVAGSAITLVNQNTPSASTLSTATLSRGRLTMFGWAGWKPIGVIHAPVSGHGHLRQFYVSNGKWIAGDVSKATGVAIAGNPSEGASGVFARDNAGHLRQFYVSNGKWIAVDVTKATGVTIAGDPVVGVSGVFARDSAGHLRQFHVANGKWIAVDVTKATGVAIAGKPSGGASGVFARDAAGHLRQFYVAHGKWTAVDVTKATGVAIAGYPYDGASGIFARGA
jgi:CHAP domain